MMRPVFRLAVAGALAIQLVLLLVSLDGGASAEDPPEVPITPATNPGEALTVETALPIADPVARAWDDAAVLISASMEVVWNQDEPVVAPSSIADGGAMTLVYAAEDRQLSLIMDRRSGVIFHAEVGEWSEELAVPLPVSSIARSSAIAVLAAEVSQGTSYRAACPDLRFVTRVFLARSSESPGNPVWLVSYVDERHRDRPDIEIAVDAVTGETIGAEATALGCAEE